MKSNIESGLGRTDIVVSKDYGENRKIYIFELKYARNLKELEKKFYEAERQMENKEYIKGFGKKGTDYEKAELICTVVCNKRYYFKNISTF